MDEPCSALDPTSTRRIEDTIGQISQDVTIVIVTHNMQQAQRVSDHCAFFLVAENEPGHIVEAGATEDSAKPRKRCGSPCDDTPPEWPPGSLPSPPRSA